MVGGGIGVTPYASILNDLVFGTSTNRYSGVSCKKVRYDRQLPAKIGNRAFWNASLKVFTFFIFHFHFFFVFFCIGIFVFFRTFYFCRHDLFFVVAIHVFLRS